MNRKTVRLKSRSKSFPSTKKKHLLIRIIEHRIFGTLLTVLGLGLPLILFIIITNYRNLIYPIRSLDQSSPQQFINEQAKILPPNFDKPQVFEHGSRFKHQVAITFDADMTQGMLLMLKNGLVKSWYNSQIIDLLHQNQVKATFFLTGL